MPVGAAIIIVAAVKYTYPHTHKRRQESVGSVATDPGTLENSKEAVREAQGAQGSSKNCTSRDNVSFLLRLIRGLHKKCN